ARRLVKYAHRKDCGEGLGGNSYAISRIFKLCCPGLCSGTPGCAPASEAHGYCSSSVRSSFSRASSSAWSPRVSTFNRTSGSVFELRRLNLQSPKSAESPSVQSTAGFIPAKCSCTLRSEEHTSELQS